MEYLDGGPVLTREALEKREKLPEPLALNYFRDMIKALDYLHAHKVIHGDLKPGEIVTLIIVTSSSVLRPFCLFCFVVDDVHLIFGFLLTL